MSLRFAVLPSRRLAGANIFLTLTRNPNPFIEIRVHLCLSVVRFHCGSARGVFIRGRFSLPSFRLLPVLLVKRKFERRSKSFALKTAETF